MALRDYYRCKNCDCKIVYGPDRSEEDWAPFLLCRACADALAAELREAKEALAKSVDARTWLADKLESACEIGIQGECQIDSLRAENEELKRRLARYEGGEKHE